ncbi:ATP-binding cassette domain-containing protein, partial [Streptococcus hyointestinalis]|uniref:ATP-binding cassette domain-containing protein n=1 Tax=Streptococcus hyointestinalis TaxID=1337 RepID=UPI003CFD145F
GYMLTFEHLTITHKKDNAVLINDLTMTINACDKVAIIGEEGCGKSTLLSFMREESAISSYAEVLGFAVETTGVLPICRRLSTQRF